MRLLLILVLVTSLALVSGKHCIMEAGEKTCSKGGDECDVANGFVCMDIPRGSSGNVKSLCGAPQDQGCWCDPSLTSQEACKEGLSCQESNHGQYKCEPSEIFTTQCHSSECAWKMVFHHNPDGSPISGSLDELLDLLKNGAEVKVWTSVYGLVNVQKVSVAYNEDIEKESAHGQSLFWASGGRGRLYNIYLVFSTSGVAHVTQFFVNSPTNAGRINSNVLLEMKWFTRRPAIKVNDKSALYQAIKDGAHIRATVEDSSRHVEVVDVTGGEISAVSVYELLDFNRGMEFYPNETRLLRHWSYGGQIQVASGMLNQPYWEFEEAQSHNIDWYVDPCWEAVFRHDASGKALFGSKDSLTEGLESGKRVKLRVGDKFYEANVIRQVEDEIVAMVYDSVDVDVTKGQWEWLTVKTSGTVNTVRFVIGGDVIQNEDQQHAEVTWFVENKQWSAVSLETPEELEARISAGADVRYSVQLNNERVWYQADFALESIMIGQVARDVYLLYNEREIVHDGTQYLQRYSFVQWRTGTFTYMDYRVGQTQQISYNAVSTTVHFFTNEVVA